MLVDEFDGLHLWALCTLAVGLVLLVGLCCLASCLRYAVLSCEMCELGPSSVIPPALALLTVGTAQVVYAVRTSQFAPDRGAGAWWAGLVLIAAAAAALAFRTLEHWNLELEDDFVRKLSPSDVSRYVDALPGGSTCNVSWM